MSTLVKRRDLTTATLEKFRGKEFKWRECDCVKIARNHLIRAGHKLPRIPSYDTPKGALRALKSKGWSSLDEMLDEFLTRVPPASMLPGDIALMDGADGELFDGLVISTGRQFFGFHQDAPGAVVVNARQIKAAWSIGI